MKICWEVKNELITMREKIKEEEKWEKIKQDKQKQKIWDLIKQY